jgi:cyclic beta-1,2-glucan synthetase
VQAASEFTGPSLGSGVELLSIEQLEEHARRLAALLTLARRNRSGGRMQLRRLEQHIRVLRTVYTSLADDARRGEPASPASEWLLDNFHIVSAATRDIHHDLPPSFFERLPRIAGEEFAGQPRIYTLARQLIRRSAGRLDAQRLQRVWVNHRVWSCRAVPV